jgi:hypothetical protein
MNISIDVTKKHMSIYIDGSTVGSLFPTEEQRDRLIKALMDGMKETDVLQVRKI